MDEMLAEIALGAAGCALAVIVRDEKTRAYLQANDPQALKQAEEALRGVTDCLKMGDSGVGHFLDRANR